MTRFVITVNPPPPVNTLLLVHTSFFVICWSSISRRTTVGLTAREVASCPPLGMAFAALSGISSDSVSLRFGFGTPGSVIRRKPFGKHRTVGQAAFTRRAVSLHSFRIAPELFQGVALAQFGMENVDEHVVVVHHDSAARWTTRLPKRPLPACMRGTMGCSPTPARNASALGDFAATIQCRAVIRQSRSPSTAKTKPLNPESRYCMAHLLGKSDAQWAFPDLPGLHLYTSVLSPA